MNPVAVDPWIVAAIIGMGLATYGTRLAGYWLLRSMRIGGRLKAALDAVPPAVLTAVIAPAVFLQGPAEMLAGASALAAALLRAPLLLTILVGVVGIVFFRYLVT